MRNYLRLIPIILCLSVTARANPGPALILYDSPKLTQPDGSEKLGYLYATMLKSLLGHFDLDVKLQPVSDYTAGELNSFPYAFYLGSYYDDPLPTAFLKDVTTTRSRVAWLKYNLWQLAWNPAYSFTDRFGMRFINVVGMDAAPTPAEPRPGFYDTVLYKGKALTKYYAYDPASGDIEADPDVGLVEIDSPQKATARVWIQDSVTGKQTPYAVQAGPQGNFWYIADMPFTFIGPRDRYLAFCDLLHDILGIQHAENHRALVRLEDVNAKDLFASMATITDFLSSRNIPFSVAAIPYYRDPLGIDNDGTPEFIPFYEATELQSSLRYAVDHGGSIVMHGYTHQYDSMKDPNSAVSADDYEFWDIVDDAPVAEDSESWAKGRLLTGEEDFQSGGFSPFAWETPHYQASPASYQAMSEIFPTGYQRVVYYTSDKPDLKETDPDHDFAAGMFFPYIIDRDAYGERIIPEDLGNIEYNISEIDPTSNITYTWRDILTNADYARVVRDGFASFFFHPFWIDPDFQNLNAFDDFKNLIDGITNLGYTWADATTVKNGDAPSP